MTPFYLDCVSEDGDKEQCEHEVGKDGVMWAVTRGAPPSMSQLEGRLSDVKALYKEKFGRDIDEEDDDADEEDGVLWTVSRGALPTISELEESLSDVKALYRAKFGEEVDSEDNGMVWFVARGAPPSMAQLEDRLSDVKALYKAKFGQDLDSEEEEDDNEEGDFEKDSVMWTVTRGAPPSLSQLEDRLSDVKALYNAKFGADLDSEKQDDNEEGSVEKDGVMWTVTRGAPPSISQLEDHLSDVKALYKAKYGEDLESEIDGEGDAEEDGVMWTVTRGAPPSMSQLEGRLSDVKALCKAKYGEDLDAEEGNDDDAQRKEEVTWNFMSMWQCLGVRTNR
jgi:hypothetical protein